MDTPNASPTIDTASAATPQVDGATPAQQAIDEMFELQAGKNPDGSPRINKVTKADLLRLAQTGYGANEKFEEAKTIKQQMQELSRMLADPEGVWDVLKHLGHDPDKLTMGRFQRNLEEGLKTPEEKEMGTLRRDAEAYRKEMAEKKARDEEERTNARANEIKTQLYTKIEGALTNLGVKAGPDAVAEVGKYIKTLARQAEAKGEAFDLESLPIEKIVKHFKNTRINTATSLFDELDEDGILSTLPPAVLEKLGRALTKKYSDQGLTPVQQPTTRGTTDKPAQKRQFISLDESRGGRNRFGA